MKVKKSLLTCRLHVGWFCMYGGKRCFAGGNFPTSSGDAGPGGPWCEYIEWQSAFGHLLSCSPEYATMSVLKAAQNANTAFSEIPVMSAFSVHT